MNSDNVARLNDLHERIMEKKRQHEFRGGLWNWTSSLLHATAILSSAAAGIAGVGGLAPIELVGGLAAAPTFAAIIGPGLKCNETVQWHRDYVVGLDDLLDQILAMPTSSSRRQLLSIADQFRTLKQTMAAKASANLGKSWDFGRDRLRSLAAAVPGAVRGRRGAAVASDAAV